MLYQAPCQLPSNIQYKQNENLIEDHPPASQLLNNRSR